MLLFPRSLKDYLKQSYVSISFLVINLIVDLNLTRQAPLSFKTSRTSMLYMQKMY